MPSCAASTASVRHVWRRFRRNGRGSAAVQFALVAPVFFALSFAIIETGIMFFASQVLETITQESARQVLTGQAADRGPIPRPSFKTMLSALRSRPHCSAATAFSSTSKAILLPTAPHAPRPPTWSSTARSIPTAISSTICSTTPEGPGDIVVVRLFHQWPLYVTGLGYNISNLSGNQGLASRDAALRRPSSPSFCRSCWYCSLERWSFRRA